MGLLSLLVLVGCGPPAGMAKPGVLTIDFVPGAAPSGDLVFTKAELHLDHIMAIGDAPPPMNQPPPMAMLDLDALDGAKDVSFGMLVPGLYSRVRFTLSQLTVTGSWRGTPLMVDLGGFMGTQVDLRSPGGHELGHDENVTLTVGVVPTGWFDGNVLDQVPPSGGTIVVDDQSAMAPGILDHIAHSFTLQ
jgi:hypothetical protein